MRILINVLLSIQLLYPLSVYSADSCSAFYAQKTIQLLSLTKQISLPGGFKWEPADLNNPKELNRIYELYKNTYSAFGIILESADKLARSRVAAVIKDPKGEIIAFMLGRLDQFGFFATQIGCSPSRRSLLLLGQTFRTPLPPGIYFQTSGHVLLANIKAGANKIIPYEKVLQIRKVQGRPIRRPTPLELSEAIRKKHLPDDPETLENAYYTTVLINNKVKEVIKVMVGNPL